MLEKPLTTNSQVPGNIHNPMYFNFWKDVLGVDENFQKFLKEGYPLPFINDIPPPSVFSRNNRSFLENVDFLLLKKSSALKNWDASIQWKSNLKLSYP